MPTNTAQYHWVSCSAKTNNLFAPTCGNTSDADFGELDTVVASALANGWSRTPNGKDFLCPMHKDASPARKVRNATPTA